MPKSDMFVNIRRALVFFIAVRALETRLFPAVVLEMRLQSFLVRVPGVAPRTMVSHFPGVPWVVSVIFVQRVTRSCLQQLQSLVVVTCTLKIKMLVLFAI